jgi:tetratricopeptide (TPR) repeat protein
MGTNPAESDADVQWARIAAELAACRERRRQDWGDVDDLTLARFLGGEASKEEVARVRRTMADHPKVRECVAVLREVFEQESERSAPVVDSPITAPLRAGAESGTHARRWFYPTIGLAAAASVLVLAGLLVPRPAAPGKGVQVVSASAEPRVAPPGTTGDRWTLRLAPPPGELRTASSQALKDSGKLDRALAEYREAIRLKPDDASLHTGLGNALRSMGDLAGALAEYREAIRLKPDDASLHTSLGNALRSMGDPAGALAEYREAIRLKPDDASLDKSQIAVRAQRVWSASAPAFNPTARGSLSGPPPQIPGSFFKVIFANSRWLVVLNQKGQQFPIEADSIGQFLIRWPADLTDLGPGVLVEATGPNVADRTIQAQHLDLFLGSDQTLVNPGFAGIRPIREPAASIHPAFQPVASKDDSAAKDPPHRAFSLPVLHDDGTPGVMHVVGNVLNVDPLRLGVPGQSVVTVLPSKPGIMSISQVTTGSASFAQKGDIVFLTPMLENAVGAKSLRVAQLLLYKTIRRDQYLR